MLQATVLTTVAMPGHWKACQQPVSAWRPPAIAADASHNLHRSKTIVKLDLASRTGAVACFMTGVGCILSWQGSVPLPPIMARYSARRSFCMPGRNSPGLQTCGAPHGEISGSRRDKSTETRTPGIPHGRSEEHTSELQSLRHLVCRLLLEKKNK